MHLSNAQERVGPSSSAKKSTHLASAGSPGSTKPAGRFMIRLTIKKISGLSMLIGVMAFAPVAVSAADANFTDRIIVKYRTAPATAAAQASQLRGTELSAARLGVEMSRVINNELG